MNGSVLLIGGGMIFCAAYFLYGRLLERVLGVDVKRRTPAHTLRDGVDYVPTRPAVLFGHHFASIAGAGPIVGPVLAAQFGWGAVALWVVAGCVLVGATHDFIALFLSVRHQGRSIGSVIESLMGYEGRLLFALGGNVMYQCQPKSPSHSQIAASSLRLHVNAAAMNSAIPADVNRNTFARCLH